MSLSNTTSTNSTNRPIKQIFLLGVGQTGKAIARILHSYTTITIYGTTRNTARIEELKDLGIIPLVGSTVTEQLDAAPDSHAPDSHIVISFPPDGSTDQLIANKFRNTAKLVYISSTGVYGSRTGYVDETTPVDDESPNTKMRLEAERLWLNSGAIVLRAPGIYGPEGGILKRLLAGSYQMPEDKNLISSRIHVDDLASIAIKALECGKPGTTYVIGDNYPCSQQEVALWLCSRLNLTTPPTVPTDLLPPTGRSNRCVNGNRVLQELGLFLKYPTYQEGFGAIVDQLRASK